MAHITVKTPEEIGREREEESREADREVRRRFISTLAWCWAFTILGAVIMAPAFHIHAIFEFQRIRAQMFFYGGLLVGTGGPLGVLLRAWWKTQNE